MSDADVRGYRLEVYRDPEDGSWVAEVPDLPGCVAGGETVDEAVDMAADAIDAWVEAAKASGRVVPLPRVVEEELSGRFVLRITRGLHAKLVRIARREGVSLNAYCATSLAEAVGTAEARHAYAVSAFAVIGVGETRQPGAFNMTVPVGPGSGPGATVVGTPTTGKVLQ